MKYLENTMLIQLWDKIRRTFQTQTDNSLKTTSKTVVGAINELNGARNPIIITGDMTEVDEETYQKLLQEGTDVILSLGDGNGSFIGLQGIFNTGDTLILMFGYSDFNENNGIIVTYAISINTSAPHTLTLAATGACNPVPKSELISVLQEIDLRGTDAERKAKLDQFETDWKALTGADDLTGARFVGRFVVTEDVVERNITGIMTYCAGDTANEKNDNCFYGICNGYSFSEQKSQIAVKVSCKDGSLTITPLFSHLEAITIYTDNTPEHIQANLDNIAAYEANLQALGVDTNRGFLVPISCGDLQGYVISRNSVQNSPYVGYISNGTTVTDCKNVLIQPTTGQVYTYTLGLKKDVDNVKTDVAALERDLGQYAKLPSVAMTAETTGKYINADGEFVDDADFNIASVGAVVVGNTYELYMGGSDKMKPGVALFVARVKTTTTSGTERIEYVPLFSAMSTDIPTSGYVCFEAMEAYSDVLVCYRADIPKATTLLVRRYGTKASIATQINNLRKKVDLKSFADGYYESMRVGTADNLTSKGDATEELIMSRKAGGDNQIEDGSASIKRIKGYSVVINQLCTAVEDEESINSSGEAWSVCLLPTNAPDEANKHKYLITVFAKAPLNKKFMLSLGNSGTQVFSNLKPESYTLIATILTKIGSASQLLFYDIDGSGEQSSIKRGQAIDLTQMFGSGNEPATPDDFAKRLGYLSIDDVPYIPYNEGEIVSSFAEGIKTTDTEGKVSERKWSETLKKYFPDGLKSAGSVYDEITPTKAVKRIGNRVYQSGDESNAAVLTDGKNTLYVLDSPEETAYDELNLTEQVAEGGTEEAIIVDGKTSTPLRADIVYPIDAYNTIKANKANIGTLSSLNTASKTDLVSAINELAGKVAALEANATEVTNETTE